MDGGGGTTPRGAAGAEKISTSSFFIIPQHARLPGGAPGLAFAASEGVVSRWVHSTVGDPKYTCCIGSVGPRGSCLVQFCFVLRVGLGWLCLAVSELVRFALFGYVSACFASLCSV